ncbi:MAG: CsbD family protein [Euryarchaeota archaeon]|nr:CsbD family protein [Euryarchaeota archaeon]
MKEGTKKQIEGNWDQFTGAIKARWGQVTDSELKQAEGNAEKLVGIIKEKTGKSQNEIERELENLTVQR